MNGEIAVMTRTTITKTQQKTRYGTMVKPEVWQKHVGV